MDVITIYMIIVFLFSYGCFIFKIFKRFPLIISTFSSTFKIIINKKIADNVKEKACKKTALELFKQGSILTFHFIIIIILTLIPLIISNHFDYVTFDTFNSFALRIDIVILTLLFFIFYSKFLTKIRLK